MTVKYNLCCRSISDPGISNASNVMNHEKLLKTLADAGVSVDATEGDFLFGPSDITFGTETELQAAVKGSRYDVDLPYTIEHSNYFANMVTRIGRGEAPMILIHGLQGYLYDKENSIWENSFVCFPRARLSVFAEKVFSGDMLANKSDERRGIRSDANRYLVYRNGVECLRVPVSYLLKLSLADAISSFPAVPGVVHQKGLRLMECFINDNTSPETHSFHVNSSGKGGLDIAVASEISRRFLLTQLLTAYANDKFGLKESGQEVFVYFSPNTPVRQKQLNRVISDAFYRELFMSPCLSGWIEGEKKHAYMHLCHEVLSRSHLNAVLKLKEAGIIHNELVVLPSTSNTSLANNGTHLSQGSRKLASVLEDPSSGFNQLHEKYTSDLVVKIFEHFLPLFIGTYTAAPYRIDFKDFHPERALGFLAHELDFTHLRMLWRRWQKKADVRIMKRPITPFGPPLLDRLLSSTFRLRGDCIPDFRLIDYPVCLMSTERSPALNGVPGNSISLKKDLAELGVFHSSMPLYLFFKAREFGVMGFSGFEGRHYSLFESFTNDFGRAAMLQSLITSLAFRYILGGKITHQHIPDSPFVESERRQVIFNSAIGVPTFYVKKDTANLFMRSIVMRTPGVRSSRRYQGYLRVTTQNYLATLIKVLRDDSGPLVEAFSIGETLDDLSDRVCGNKENSATLRLLGGIKKRAGVRSVFDLNGEDFNLAAEQYYREYLREKHMDESVRLFIDDLSKQEKDLYLHDGDLRAVLEEVVPKGSAVQYVMNTAKDLIKGCLPVQETSRLIQLVILAEHAEVAEERSERGMHGTTPVHCAGNE